MQRKQSRPKKNSSFSFFKNKYYGNSRFCWITGEKIVYAGFTGHRKKKKKKKKKK
jgi:hypothetical protein